MSEIIHSKATGSKLLQNAIKKVGISDIKRFAKEVNTILLSEKIKFPVLEHCGVELYNTLNPKDHIAFANFLTEPKEMGSWVVVGKLLQCRLEEHFDESLNKAVEYILAGNEWYVCDIVGERVIGHGLLTYPDKTIPKLKQFTLHNNKWIVRSVGVAAHYATKKGLQMPHIEAVFKLLLSQANTTDFHTKKGIGWGAKTIAKKHPELIKKYYSQIFDNPEVKQWFKTKINIGLNWITYKEKKVQEAENAH